MAHVKTFRPVVVRCRGIAKEFGSGATRTSAVCDAELDVLANELTMLVGPSGSGKTTLLSIIAGILKADTGQIEVFGNRIEAFNGATLAAFRAEWVGFIPQQFNLLPALTTLENVAIPLLVQRVPQRQAQACAAALLEEFDLGSHATKYPGELSMGQQQRVVIARALIHEPRLVVCDEPTAALDVASGLAAIQVLRRVTLRQDRTVIVVTHDPRILPFADRIATMSDGRVIGNEVCTGRNAA